MKEKNLEETILNKIKRMKFYPKENFKNDS